MLLGVRHLLLQEVLGRLQAVVPYKSLCKDKTHEENIPMKQKKGVKPVDEVVYFQYRST